MFWKRKHPDSKLTLRKAYDKHYDMSRLSGTTQLAFKHLFNVWERITSNPPVCEIDTATLEEFRDTLLKRGNSPKTLQTKWGMIRSILRRLAKPNYGNPRGLSIIESVAVLETPRWTPPRPKRVSLEIMGRFYLACGKATRPRMGDVPSYWWWRCLIVLAYFTGLRKGDLFKIRLADIDLEKQTLSVRANKTGKADLFYLHPVAVEHLRKLWHPGEFLFTENLEVNRQFYDWWNSISRTACLGADERFGLQSLRKTAASEAESVRPGAGAMLLQHRPTDVTGRHYLDMSDVLRDVIDQMQVPLEFKHGIQLTVRAEHRAERVQQAKLHVRSFTPAEIPKPEDFEFEEGAFAFRGRWCSVKGAPWRVLKCLALSAEPVAYETLADAVFLHHVNPPADFMSRSGRVNSTISQLRVRLRRFLSLDDNFDPVPCVKRGNGGEWGLYFASPL